MESLTLQRVVFDGQNRTITLDRPYDVNELYILVKEAFMLSNLLTYTFPLEVLDTRSRLYYVFSWKVIGEVRNEERNGVAHLFVGP